MSASFAGSRALDERRRRRIASEDGQETQLFLDGPHFPLTARSVPVSAPEAQFPINQALTNRTWKLVAILAVVFLTGGAVWGLNLMAASLTKLPPQLAEMMRFAADSLANWFCAAMLLVSGQLALVIRWARSRSQTDYEGRYRFWAWVGVLWMLGALALTANLHLLISRSIHVLWPRDFAGKELLCWLPPVAGLAMTIWWNLHREMRGCRTSLTFFWVANLCWCLTVGLLLGKPAGLSPLVALATQFLGYFCLFGASLWHARYVVYENSEPWIPPVKPKKEKKPKAEKKSKTAAAEEKAGEKKAPRTSTRKPAGRKPLTVEGEATDTADTEAKSTPELAAKPEPPKVEKPAPKPEPPKVEKTAPKPEPPKVEKPAAKPEPPKVEKPAAKPEPPADVEDDPEEDDGDDAGDGLNKRLRRKLRKQQKTKK